jgi:two-component sensor histidine kinase
LAVDITDRKKREELENKLKMREELYKIAREVAHDICSPLSALEMVKYMSLDKLEEQEKKMFELSVRRIKDIASKLIERYRGKEDKGSKEEEYIMPSSVKEIIESMRYRYQERGIKFKFKEEEREKFAFIKGGFTNFSRMITNVIKNGVEAIEGKEGEIEVREEVKGEEVEIRVKDNGKGMSKEMVEKIERWEDVGTTKKGGHGIGMGQIMGTIKAMRGKVDIETREGEGTEFILTFPKVERPRWFADKIEIKKGDEVVIVDDEELMHEVWKAKLKAYEKEIKLKFFTQGVEALKYLRSLENKEKVFLLTDYRLKGQEVNGIDIIEEAGMKERHILVTGEEVSRIKDFNEKSTFLKMLPKIYINDISLELVQVEEENIISD